ncbi:hypothetical protein OV320_7848 [Actinobacteria bacterium OV320]|jgi:hypothetical protein|nr:hypothetical protein OV320_7848 [Actinobacteria bacterium OV320]
MLRELSARELVSGMRIFVPSKFNDGSLGHWETVTVTTFSDGMREYSTGLEFFVPSGPVLVADNEEDEELIYFVGEIRTVTQVIEGKSYELRYEVESVRQVTKGRAHVRLSGYCITETEDTGCAMYPYSVGRPVSEQLS